MLLTLHRTNFAPVAMLNSLSFFLVAFFACNLLRGEWVVAQAREIRAIQDQWTLSAANSPDKGIAVTLGDSWEEVLGPDYDGQASYTRAIHRQDIPGGLDALHSNRLLVEVDGAATRAKIFWNDHFLGSHLGGWTPFRVDLTDLLRQHHDEPTAKNDQTSLKDSPLGFLRIELDELVGHNTQGFLPIVVPHFGGIWKGVRLLRVPDPMYLDDLTLHIDGFQGDDTFHCTVAVRGGTQGNLEDYEVGFQVIDHAEHDSNIYLSQVANINSPDSTTSTVLWSPLQKVTLGADNHIRAAGNDLLKGTASGQLKIASAKRWSPAVPHRYLLTISLRDRTTGKIIDSLQCWSALRHFRTEGPRLLVNGDPVQVRGVLNWGYAPPRLAPSLDREWMRAELDFAKQRGFNLMKFCLWIPPREYLELADEMGMLTWDEYPTWHPRFDEETQEALEEEFAEFFCYDRNHPSVLLRSLTCETGPSASEEVIRRLYDQAHRMIPGAIVEDDSSWIEWHRVHDFYDDHPYGNNHTWLATLERLESHIAARKSMPLVLGEAIAADTWELEPTLDEASSDPAGPHAMRSRGALEDYQVFLSESHGAKALDRIRQDSLRYALDMRKYQMETIRWRLPHAGYVVSVIRDFPLASMGLIDRANRAKWSPQSFAWHGPNQLVFNRGTVQRIYAAGRQEPFHVDLVAESYLASAGNLTVTLTQNQTQHVTFSSTFPCIRDEMGRLGVSWQMELPNVDKPQRFDLNVSWSNDNQSATNSWSLWLVPSEDTDVQADSSGAQQQVSYHPSVSDSIRQQLRVTETIDWSHAQHKTDGTVIAIAQSFDPDLIHWLQAGGRCLFLPSGESLSLPIRDHWFLRGGPVLAAHPLAEGPLGEMLVECQAFDYASPVAFAFDWLAKGSPILSLWDNHDLTSFRTHTLLWEARVGNGKLLVCALDLIGKRATESGDTARATSPGAAGRYLLTQLLAHLRGNDYQPQALTAVDIQQLLAETVQQQVALSDSPWRFRRLGPEERNSPVPLREDTSGTSWQNIEITRHWDGQGHGDLDGWGIYRTQWSIPKNWNHHPLHIITTGIDDYFELYVNGQLIGTGGNIEKRETAFELRASFLVPADISTSEPLDIAVRVYDWQGAGGIFRPVYVSTSELTSDRSLLVPRTTATP
jgi:hypothetical protein